MDADHQSAGAPSSKKSKNHVRRLSANSPVIIIWQVAECAQTLSIWRDLGRDSRGTERLFLKEREAREHAGHVPHLPLPAPHGRVLIRALGGWAGAVSLNANGRFLHGRRAPPKISPHEREDLAETSAARSNGGPHVVVVVVLEALSSGRTFCTDSERPAQPGGDNEEVENKKQGDWELPSPTL